MYQNILIPLDGSDVAECSLAHAKAIAKAFQVYKLFLIRVLTPFSSRTLSRIPGKKLEIVAQSSEVEAWRYLSEIAANLAKEGVNTEPVVVSGKPAEQIVGFAKSSSIDLIVMATHGRSGVSRRPYGSVAKRVARTSPVPILVVIPPA
jgi:nucleotide-binding universal stress UspA family protein